MIGEITIEVVLDPEITLEGAVDLYKEVAGAETLSVSFTADETNPSLGIEVTFTATGDVGDGFLHVWDFGDGSAVEVEDDAVISHTYASEGEYDVELWVIRRSDNAIGNLLRADYIDVVNAFAFGNALQFDGVNDLLQFTDLTGSVSSGTVAMSWWARFDRFGEVMFTRGDATTLLVFFQSNNSMRVRWLTSGTSYTLDFSSLSTNTWYHFFIYNIGTTIYLYINGALADTVVEAGGDNFSLGYVGGYSGFDFAGRLNELAVWKDISPNSTHAAALYNSGDGADAASIGLGTPRRYYKLEESGSDSVAIDSGSDSQNGTLTNFTLPGAWVAH